MKEYLVLWFWLFIDIIDVYAKLAVKRYTFRVSGKTDYKLMLFEISVSYFVRGKI